MQPEDIQTFTGLNGEVRGFRVSDLISGEYLHEQKLLHAKPEGYGGKGSKWADAVRVLAQFHQCSSILDYGCGEGSLGRALSALRVREYDPAIKGKDALPKPADLVVVTDVLEHIEPDRIDAVLSHLRALTRKVLFAVIATRPANKVLSDGRNAHILLRDADWWAASLVNSGFRIEAQPPQSPSVKPSREVVFLLT